MLKSEIKIMIVGGGSGGHISVAKSVINTLIEEYNIPKDNLTYVGGDLGMEGEKIGKSLEKELFKESDIKTYFIRAGKLQRKFSLKSLNLLLRTYLGYRDSCKIIKKVKPTLVISTGGFVSVPICIAANNKKIPVYLHEQTASVGLSNRIVGRFAKKIFLAFKDSSKYFKKRNTLHVGNIVRKEIFQDEITNRTDREIIQLIGNDKKLPFIYISGGSLGSHILNEKVLSSLDELLKSYRILLQTGNNEINKDFEKALEQRNKLFDERRNRVLIRKYIDSDNIGYVLNSMDLFLGRSGANTVYEIGVLKKIALFVPIPWVTNNEQYKNALVLEKIGRANILKEDFFLQCNIGKEIEILLKRISVKKIDTGKLDSLFPTNAVYSMLEDILEGYLKK